MILHLGAVLAGLIAVVWAADRFIDGSAALARYLGMPPLLIGMVIVGFGTSAPELAVSVIAAADGSPGLALGNAYGSNIANIGLILGITALLYPLAVHSLAVRKELPILLAVTALAIAQLSDGTIGRPDALLLLAVFAGLMGWSLRVGLKGGADPLAAETGAELAARGLTRSAAALWAVIGLLLLVVGSRVLVWGAVEVARDSGVSELIIGLTVVAVGTSLPELASSLLAVRKGESDIAFGNIIGSNLFNTLAVVGLAGVIAPIDVTPDALYRDGAVMMAMTVALFAYCLWCGKEPRIGRAAGSILLIAYLAYAVALGAQAFDF